MDKKELKKIYEEKTGKKAFPGWTEEQLQKRIDNFQSDDSKKTLKEDDGLMMVSRDQLQDMINEATQKALGSQPKEPDFTEWQEYTPPKNKNKTATLKIYQPVKSEPGGVVTKVDYDKIVWNDEEHKHNKVMYKIEVTYDDGTKKEFDIDAIVYSEINQRETVELIDVDRKVLKKSSGKTVLNLPNDKGIIVRNAAGGGYGVSMGGQYEVDLDEYKVDEVFTVKRKNGQTFKIHANYLNN